MTTTETLSIEQPKRPQGFLQTVGAIATQELGSKPPNLLPGTYRALKVIATKARENTQVPESLSADALVLHGIITAVAIPLAVRANLKIRDELPASAAETSNLLAPRYIEAQLKLTQRVFVEWPDHTGGKLQTIRAKRMKGLIDDAQEARASYPQIDLVLTLGASTLPNLPHDDPGAIAIRELTAAYGGAAQTTGEQMDAKMTLLRDTGTIYLKNSL